MTNELKKPVTLDMSLDEIDDLPQFELSLPAHIMSF